eukprot:TRINITY_DN10888_c2_g1_i1.p1 TRINITY_DN10888_c2_g1~~TRINITY_DN10888_c2_g1_i1.p1  ORF type:complete len:276 (+),score=51.08 TRINITY_DN10888_c2_g1_i1:57-884(+)
MPEVRGDTEVFDEDCIDLCPLFEDRLVSHAQPCVEFDFGKGVRLQLRQDLAGRRRLDSEAPKCCPTEKDTRTGAVVWDAAVALAAVLVAGGTGSDGQPIGPWGSLLELGAGGHGLCGISALLAGQCTAAVLSDRPALLAQLEDNVAQNLGEDYGSRCSIRPLLWGEVGSIARVHSEALQGAPGSGFDVVVAADCVYDVESAEALAITIAEALHCSDDRGGGEALVAFDRALGRHCAYRRFLDRCAVEGLEAEELLQPSGHFQKDSVAMYRLVLRK